MVTQNRAEKKFSRKLGNLDFVTSTLRQFRIIALLILAGKKNTRKLMKLMYTKKPPDHMDSLTKKIRKFRSRQSVP